MPGAVSNILRRRLNGALNLLAQPEFRAIRLSRCALNRIGALANRTKSIDGSALGTIAENCFD
jgi:hypothetical protein